MTATAQDLKKYELMVIFSGEIPEKDFEREVEKVREALKEYTKKIDYEAVWGKMEFAYRVKKQKRGYYAIFNFAAQPAQILELRSNIKLNPYVLRHLLLVLPENYEYGKYREQVLRERTVKEEKKVLEKHAKVAPLSGAAAPADKAPSGALADKPKIAGKAEEQELENVEKKLEKILENPDIDIK
ncbi:30S ribosomal protein S6 [Candidatus Peregrinibacteria bacterium]|nr:30S ribosomal protein S6 [Candidatus Peregrinibacteria bacterium]